MPLGDRTGPLGMGPGAGRRMGPCYNGAANAMPSGAFGNVGGADRRGLGLGRRGFGRGLGRGRGYGAVGVRKIR